MTSAEQLADVVTALEGVGLTCLVMGGHAVRYYGLERTTNDFDLHLAAEGWQELSVRLAGSGLFAGRDPVEGPSWRPHAFRRFELSRSADGREVWLEFWRSNHLLGPFPHLHARRETGVYGDRKLPFLALADLIRSKETERERDWQDIAYLEGALDTRRLAGNGGFPVALALAELRSPQGFATAQLRGHLADADLVAEALTAARCPMSQAYLLPALPTFAGEVLATAAPIEPVVLQRLRQVQPGTPMHVALVEIVRRHYKAVRQEEDRADKQREREG